jgi:hypothetical protein
VGRIDLLKTIHWYILLKTRTMKNFLSTLRKATTIATIAVAAPFLSEAQIYFGGPSFEAGVTFAGSGFLGDLGGNAGEGTTFIKDLNLQTTKFFAGAHFTYYPKNWLGLRLAVNYGKLEGDDNLAEDKPSASGSRRRRNLNFRSDVLEGMLLAEIYPTTFFEAEPDDALHKLRPYGMFGVGVFHFNPEGYDPIGQSWVNLQPLATEGQGSSAHPDRKPYSLIQLSLPVGIGLKYQLSEGTTLGLELIHRVTFTDYIDDVSTNYVDPAIYKQIYSGNQAMVDLSTRMANKADVPSLYTPGARRGDPTENDSFFSFGFKLGFILGGGSGWGSGNSMKCPTNF